MAANTSSRLKEIMAQRNLRQADILRMAQPYCEKYKIKLGKSDLSQFVSGKVEPGQWKLTILGLALDVSEAWLMGLDVPMDRDENNPPTFAGGGADIDHDLVTKLVRLTPEEQEKVVAFVQGLIAARPKPTSPLE